MRKVSLRSLWDHKRRLVSTVLAIVLGVAFMSGTFVLADTMNRVFDDLFATVNEHVDARVEGEVLISIPQGGDFRGRFDQSLLDQVAAVDGVAKALPFATTIGFGPTNRVLGADGDAIGASQGPPTLIQSWIDDDELRPYELTDGSRGPAADDEIALNVAAADDGDLHVGDQVTLASQFGNQQYTLVGTFTFGGNESAAGAVSAEFTLPEVQRLAGAEGQLDSIIVAADDGISQQEIADRIARILPSGTEVITGKAAIQEDAESVQEGFQFFTIILSVFGAIALVVGMFIIYNTFQILVAQRTRELALLRAVGASRRQVLGSVLLEAVTVGAVAAGTGILAGVGLAAAALAILKAFGVDLPSAGLVVDSNTVVSGLIIGLVVTVVAALFPAIKATRVPPLAAMRDVAIDRSAGSRRRLVIGVLVLLLAAFNVSRAWTADGDTDAIPGVGLGVLLLLVGAIVVGPVLAAPSVRLVGFFLPKWRGVTGRLSTENAARSPKRTSATASALLIGVALVGFITVFAKSATASVTSEVERGLTADLIVQQSGSFFGGFGGFSPEVATRIAAVPGVDSVSSLAATPSRITYPDGDTADTWIGAVHGAEFAKVADPRMEAGYSLADLSPGHVLVDRQIAEDNQLQVGDAVTMTMPGGGQLQEQIAGISDDLVVLAYWTIDRADFDSAVGEVTDAQVYVTVTPGADIAEVQEAVETAIAEFPELEVLDQDGFIGDVAGSLTAILNTVYALLALSVLIGMIGVANTLSLSVHERTRELGLLRAVGMGRDQLAETIRWEAVLISVLGTLVGLGLGLLAGYIMITALDGVGLTTFAVPVVRLAVLVVIFGLFGVAASLWTSHKASKLDILAAIAHE